MYSQSQKCHEGGGNKARVCYPQSGNYLQKIAEENVMFSVITYKTRILIRILPSKSHFRLILLSPPL